MSKEGYKQKEIAKIIKCNQTTVSRLLSKCRSTGTSDRKSGSGRKPKLNRAEKLKIKRIINENPQFSTHEVARETQLFGKVSISTISRHMRSIGLFSRVAAKSSVISRIHRRKRLFFARFCKMFYKNKWDNVYFSDETSIKMSSRWRILIRRPKNARFNRKYVVKHIYSEKRSVMFWGYIKSNGDRFLMHVPGHINSIKYIEILKEAFPIFPNEGILQQDRAPCHHSHLTLDFMSDYNIELLRFWPPNSPDLNPIENIWANVKRELKGMTFKNIELLKSKVLTVFNNIPAYVVRTICQSMDRRLNGVISYGGGSTKY